MRTVSKWMALACACVALNGFSTEEQIEITPPNAPIAGTEEVNKGEETPALLSQQEEEVVANQPSGCGCGKKHQKA